jgi:hypothetical protein
METIECWCGRKLSVKECTEVVFFSFCAMCRRLVRRNQEESQNATDRNEAEHEANTSRQEQRD